MGLRVQSGRLPDRPKGSGLWGYGSDRVGYPIGLWGQGYGLGVGSDRLPDRAMGSGLWGYGSDRVGYPIGLWGQGYGVRGRIGSATR